MEVVHDRSKRRQRIVWLAEPGRKEDFIIVMMDGGSGYIQAARENRRLGFAVETRADVDRIAIQAKREGCLVWDTVEEPYPVGYYCGVRDPDGNCVEFSFGQPIGPGSEPF